MRIMCLEEPAMSAQKKPTNLTINADLMREAKALDINLSPAFEIHLAELVNTNKQEKWLVENREAIDAYNRFADAWNRAAAGEVIIPRIAFGSYAELFSTLPGSRFELLRHVVRQPGLSLSQFVMQIGRESKLIEADVKALVDIGLIEQDAKGNLAAPYDEILIHADLTKAA
jgi:antitoxin CcdA